MNDCIELFTKNLVCRVILMLYFCCFQEVDLGLMADVGTIQRLPKLIGNASLLRELVYTARKFTADEALKLGMVR